MTPKQVNFRVEQQYQDVLDAVAYLEERSGADVAREVVQAYLDRRRSDPDVDALLRLRNQKRGEGSGEITPLRKSTRSRGEEPE